MAQKNHKRINIILFCAVGFLAVAMASVFLFSGSIFSFQPKDNRDSIKEHPVKVSVVVPIYKVEKYLPECLDSLINQTLQEIEIICVNDGSPDDCLKILEDYKAKDPRIKIISQENGGLSSARNRGIENSTGEYIAFVDSDDAVTKNFCEINYENAKKKDVDVILFGMMDFVDGDPRPEDPIYKSGEVIYGTIPKGVNPFDKAELGHGTVCDKFWKASFVLENNLYFKEDVKYGEDTMYNWLAQVKVRSYAKDAGNVFYFYRKWREGSIMNITGEKKRINQYLNIIRHLVENQDSFDFKNGNLWILSKVLLLSRSELTDAALETFEEKRKYSQKLFEIIDEKLLKNLKSKISNNDLKRIKELRNLGI